ncbi:MAG: hypothetical protein LAQ69_48990, partial [Acidobacteriia bacterium]|nr:hypothetical protein [Terriglobia bacterium]
ELLQESHREPLPPAHFAAVRARVLAELERQRRPFWRRGWVFGLAAVAVALLVMMLAIRPGPAPTARPPMVATEHPPVPPEPLATGTQPDEGVSPIQSVLPASPPHKRRARPKMETGEPVLIRVVQDNPDVVIYWIADTTGE